jgi:hypothetical protein
MKYLVLGTLRNDFGFNSQQMLKGYRFISVVKFTQGTSTVRKNE